MANSVYSIVLNDAVVEAIDRLAYQNGTNRSSMINRILAERVSYTTPEQRIRNILCRKEPWFHGTVSDFNEYGRFLP